MFPWSYLYVTTDNKTNTLKNDKIGAVILSPVQQEEESNAVVLKLIKSGEESHDIGSKH